MESLLQSSIIKLLYSSFESIALRDLKRKLSSYIGEAKDDEIQTVLNQLKLEGIIEIDKERFGTMTEEVIRLTPKAVKRSSSA